MSISSIGSSIINAAKDFVSDIKTKMTTSPFGGIFKKLMNKCSRSMTNATGSSQLRSVRENTGESVFSSEVRQQYSRSTLNEKIQNLLSQTNDEKNRDYLASLSRDLNREDGKEMSIPLAGILIERYEQCVRSNQACPVYKQEKIETIILVCMQKAEAAEKADKTEEIKFLNELFSSYKGGRINYNEAVGLLTSYRNYLSVKKDTPKIARCPKFEEELALLREANAMKTKIQ